MQKEMVDLIVEITGKLARILVTIEPANPAEWEAMEKIQAAHKQMRNIEIAELAEQPPRAVLTR